MRDFVGSVGAWTRERIADIGQAAVLFVRLVLLAQTRSGYGQLSQWITLARQRAGKGCYQAYRSDVEAAPARPQDRPPDGPLAGLDRQLARGRLEPEGPHLPPPPDLRRPGQARLRADGQARVSGAGL